LRDLLLAEPALVGRERELKELLRYLESASAGKGATILVSGEAGTGKTRLIHEFLKTVQENEMNVLSGWCLSNAVTPYFPFVEAFKSYFSAANGKRVQHEGLEIIAWLTGLKQSENSETYRNLAPQVWKDLTFEVVSKTLQSISTEKPTVLFIEDVHWADSASLALLHYISRTLGSERLLVLATFRSEELTADVEGYDHPLAEELRLMRRENLVREIHLADLDQACVTIIVENMMGGRVDPELAERLTKESRGNALFVVESLRMLFERGSLYKEGEQWFLTVDNLGIPNKIKDVILRRLSQLRFNQRRALDAASVIGEKFDVNLLSVVLNQDSLEVLENLNTIARSTSLIGVEEEFFRFDHARSREAIYEEMALPLKRGYHRRIAEKLESAESGGRLPFSDIAYHYAEAGNEEKAVEFAIAAGQDALARFSNTEAIKHFAYVLQTAPRVSRSSEIRNVALEGLGDAYYANRSYRKAAEVFEHLAIAETGMVRLRAYRKAMDAVLFGPGDRKQVKTRLLNLANQAEPYAAYDRLESARIRFLKSPSASDRTKEADAVLQVFEEEYSLPDVARALSVRALGEALEGLKKKSLSDSQRAIAMQKELYGDSGPLSLATTSSMQVFLAAGLLQESCAIITEALRIGEKVGDFHHAGNASAVMSRLLEIWGKTEEALSTSFKGLEFLEKTDGTRRQDRIFADIARQYAKLGSLSHAEEYIRKSTSQALVTQDFVDPQGLLNKRDSIRSQGVVLAASNQWNEAYHYLDEALEIAKIAPMYPMFSQVVVRMDYVWILNKQGKTKEAQAHLSEIQRLYDEVDREFAHVYIAANLLAPKNVVAGEEFEMRLDLINISRKISRITKIQEFAPLEFKIVSLLAGYAVENGVVDMQEERIGSFEVKTIKLRLKALKPGVFSVSPQVTYIDEIGEVQTCRSNQVTITAMPAPPKFEVLPGRITTGFEDLDALLFGGIPEKFAVALSSPSTDKRESLIRRFLLAGAEAGEITFHITAEAEYAEALAEKYPSNFRLILCNPQADTTIKELPNIFKLKGAENLTDIDIALTKALRILKPSESGPRRICIDIVSDVLLQHHPVTTRRWLSALLPTLKSKGFTVLATVNPKMHPQEEIEAILGFFEGEIRVTEKETPEGIKQTLRVRKLVNQRYLEKEIVLGKEKIF